MYPSGVAFYDTRHDAVTRFVPYRIVERCSLSRGIAPRLFGVGSVCLHLKEVPGAGRFRTVLTVDGSARESVGSDEHVASLRALREPEGAYELIDQRV